jgi:hypothetical protein
MQNSDHKSPLPNPLPKDYLLPLPFPLPLPLPKNFSLPLPFGSEKTTPANAYPVYLGCAILLRIIIHNIFRYFKLDRLSIPIIDIFDDIDYRMALTYTRLLRGCLNVRFCVQIAVRFGVGFRALSGLQFNFQLFCFCYVLTSS